ncbi:MAG: mismatch-specific DNA-glycosylase [Candidatus Rokubacteria bacterium]|nr:mismatch-specific DNA-glycosylase [Candidatus Rokubacteria bacterium]MBI2543920.1 mismatch-specific DNA-glycosylase [Candidatus Rokubacteria bacterium]
MIGRPDSSLEPLLRRGLAVVFIGTEPGEESLRIGHYYANPSNSFYADLKKTAFTSVQLTPEEDRLLLSRGIGLDDVYHDPEALQDRLESVRPRAVCFNSKGALERYVGRKVSGEWHGKAAGKHAKLGIKCITWAVPDSSGLACRFHCERVQLLRDLKRELLKRSLERESALVRADSLEALETLERLEDTLPR